MKKLLLSVFAAAMLLCLSACSDSTETITVNADGSGSYLYEVSLNLDEFFDAYLNIMKAEGRFDDENLEDWIVYKEEYRESLISQIETLPEQERWLFQRFGIEFDYDLYTNDDGQEIIGYRLAFDYASPNVFNEISENLYDMMSSARINIETHSWGETLTVCAEHTSAAAIDEQLGEYGGFSGFYSSKITINLNGWDIVKTNAADITDTDGGSTLVWTQEDDVFFALLTASRITDPEAANKEISRAEAAYEFYVNYSYDKSLQKLDVADSDALSGVEFSGLADVVSGRFLKDCDDLTRIYRYAISWCVAYDIMYGTKQEPGGIYFSPDTALTREMFVTTLFRHYAVDVTDEHALRYFSRLFYLPHSAETADAASVSIWAKQSFAAASNLGMLPRMEEDWFFPQKPITRYEFDTLLTAFFAAVSADF